jgi:hypothetical protein
MKVSSINMSGDHLCPWSTSTKRLCNTQKPLLKPTAHNHDRHMLHKVLTLSTQFTVLALIAMASSALASPPIYCPAPGQCTGGRSVA